MTYSTKKVLKVVDLWAYLAYNIYMMQKTGTKTAHVANKQQSKKKRLQVSPFCSIIEFVLNHSTQRKTNVSLYHY